MMDKRQQIQQTYIRICGDSGCRMKPVDAVHFTAKILEISAIDVWVALGTNNMERIAAGEYQYSDAAAEQADDMRTNLSEQQIDELRLQIAALHRTK